MHNELPGEIQKIVKGFTYEKSSSGLSGAGVYNYRSETESYYLKIVDNSNRFLDELETEYKLLKWLKGKFPAPKVICYEKIKDKSYLLTTEVEGLTLEALYNQGVFVENVIRIYGESLKLIHGIDTTNSPVIASDEVMLSKAKRYLELGIDAENIEEVYNGMTPNQLYEKLLSLKPAVNENVFIHGDYCTDNLIIKDNRLSGIIDIGRGGIGDRYMDIALAVRSIRHDFGEVWIDFFFKTYGIDNPNWDKIEFYTILDEFY